MLTATGGDSPLLFSLFTHTGSAVEPAPGSPQGVAPPLPPPRPPTSSLSPHAILLRELDEAVSLAKNFQLWGEDWDALVAAGAAPALLTGAFARSRPSGAYNGTAAALLEWKNKVRERCRSRL